MWKFENGYSYWRHFFIAYVIAYISQTYINDVWRRGHIFLLKKESGCDAILACIFIYRSSSSLFWFEYLLWKMNDIEEAWRIVEILEEMKIMTVNLRGVRQHLVSWVEISQHY